MYAHTTAGAPRSFRSLKSILPVLVVFWAVAPSQRAEAYAVLTHQELIDQCWQSTIVPLLVGRFPALTPEQLREAHAAAYGGSVIQDLGYYPFSNPFFSNLTHYVRSG